MRSAPGKKIEAIDLFCGIGGLTRGLQKAGVHVTVGIDNDPKCAYGYEKSTGTRFVLKDIEKVTAKEIRGFYSQKSIKVLAGCAPCQPYSGLNRKERTDKDNAPIKKFASLVRQVKPEIVTMENVRRLKDTPIFEYFVKTLKRNSYEVWYDVVNAADYGVPQERKRLVLFASRIGKEISLIDPTHRNSPRTVRKAIGSLERIKDGETSKKDPLHYARKLSDLNKKRILATPRNGGSVKNWGKHLLLDCYRKKSGQTYMGTVYGRMRWDDPSPTMTTQCIGLGNGRFGHPEQHRAISLREAAILQTFPKNYTFSDPKEKMVVADVSKFIGNAVPIKLAEAIGKSITKHVVSS